MSPLAISPLLEHTKASNSNDGDGCTGEVRFQLSCLSINLCLLVNSVVFLILASDIVFFFTCWGFNQMSELSTLEEGWLCLLVLGSSSLLAALLLPFPVMTIIIILQQNEFFCQSNTFTEF